MANNGPIPNFQPRDTTIFLCKDCGVCFDSADSLDVHRQYHKENLLMKWANQAAQANGQAGETNNNNAKTVNVKREFVSTLPSTIAAAADSSDTTTMKSTNKSPESYNSSATPEMTTPAGHPATPQSYHSAPSPYQNPEPTNFSPGFHNFHVKPESHSPGSHYPTYPPNPQFSDNQYFNMEPPQTQLPYQQDYQNNKLHNTHGGQFRYHPYSNSAQFERSAQVSSSSNHSPSYATQNPQPTPSPSPKQCDKCGFVCETAGQLMEHLQIAHPATPFNLNQQQTFQFPGEPNEPKLKQEEEPQAEILDLDSQKVHVYQTPEEQEDAMKRQAELVALNGGHHPHSVSAMLSWSNSAQQQQPPQQKIFTQQNSHEHRMFSNGTEQIYIKEEKLFPNPHDQKLFQPHQMHNSDFLPNSTTTHDSNNPNMVVPNMNTQQPQVPHAYRPYDHIPVQPNPPVISSTQVANTLPPANIPAPVAKGANWKSNEARRPKTYNCSACNKWFTSSGHLKRHYNTTLHKNAVKSSGQPDPATLPISAHHHPARDPNHQSTRQQQQQHQDTNTQSPIPMQLPAAADESNSEDNGLAPAYERTQHPGLLQQPPSGPYDRHPPNIGGPQPNMHSSLSQNPTNNLTNLSSGSPPNGEAGPSANNLELSRGLQSTSTSTTNIPHQLTPLSQIVSNIPQASNQLPPFNLLNQQPHMMAIPSTATSQIFHPMGPPQISANYPNGLSPHVTPTTTAINNQLPALISLTTTGEYYQEQYLEVPIDSGPLPSFSQFATLLPGSAPSIGNVGGPSLATDSQLYQQFAFIPPNAEQPEFITSDLQETNLMHDQTFSPEPHIIYRTLPPETNYEITVLQPVNQNIQQIKQPDHYSPTNQNNNHFTDDDKQTSVELSPNANANVQNENESLITSTSSPPSKKKKASSSGIRECIDCQKTFNKACYLTQHNKTFHMGIKPFKCSRCGKRFSTDETFQSHISKHAGDKPHKCEQCPKQFNHKTDLRRHMCLHSGYKPFKCETCGKGFIRKDHMLKHCDTHFRKPKGPGRRSRSRSA